MPSGWSGSSTERFSGWDIIPTQGTQAWDAFMSLVATTRKLGISFFEYVRDRISQLGNIPSLATIIREQSSLNHLACS